jgi:hypothetical protein
MKKVGVFIKKLADTAEKVNKAVLLPIGMDILTAPKRAVKGTSEGLKDSPKTVMATIRLFQNKGSAEDRKTVEKFGKSTKDAVEGSGTLASLALTARSAAKVFGKKPVVESIKGIKLPDSRPAHQHLLEEAAKAGDQKKINAILDRIPKNDPYKTSMEHVFRSKSSSPSVQGTSVTFGRGVIRKEDVMGAEKAGKSISEFMKTKTVPSETNRARVFNELVNKLQKVAESGGSENDFKKIIDKLPDNVNYKDLLGKAFPLKTSPAKKIVETGVKKSQTIIKALEKSGLTY